MTILAETIPAGYKQTEVGVIPSDWDVQSLEKLARIERGKFTARPRNDPKYYGGDIPFIQTGDVTNASGKITTYSQTLNSKGLKVSKLFPRGTLFFTIAANIGDVGSAAFDTACPDSLVAITPTKTTDKAWLAYELAKRKASFENIATQNAQLNINLEKLRPYLLPVPPHAEQTAIAGVLSDADALIQGLEKLIAKKRAVKRGAMQELLTGKRRLPGFSGKWGKKKLGEIVVEFKHGQGLQKSDLNDSGPYKCIHYGQLFTEYKEFIQRINSRTNVRTGHTYSKENDVLMPTSDVTPRGLAAARCVKESGIVLGGGILIIRLQAGYDGLFLSYYITQHKISVLKLVKGSTVFHLYANDLATLEVSFPDHSEQTAIVTVLSDMDTGIEKLELQLSKYRNLKQGMMQVLLTGKIRLPH